MYNTDRTLILVCGGFPCIHYQCARAGRHLCESHFRLLPRPPFCSVGEPTAGDGCDPRIEPSLVMEPHHIGFHTRYSSRLSGNRYKDYPIPNGKRLVLSGSLRTLLRKQECRSDGSGDSSTGLRDPFKKCRRRSVTLIGKQGDKWCNALRAL